LSMPKEYSASDTGTQEACNIRQQELLSYPKNTLVLY
jgi:hypothetical protein